MTVSELLLSLRLMVAFLFLLVHPENGLRLRGFLLMLIRKIKNIWKSLQRKPTNSITVQSYPISSYPIFDIQSTYNKLYEANGEKEVTLTAQEADELLDYIQYVTWLTNPPHETDWYHTLQARANERNR